MKKNKKQKTKFFYKKSIWPSIVLFVIFIGSCAVMPVSFADAFKGYLLDSRMTDIHSDAEKLGKLFLSARDEKSFYDAVSFLEKYIAEEHDVCVTDGSGRVVHQSGRNRPDLKQTQKVTFIIEEYTVIPDADTGTARWENILEMSSWEFLKRSMETFPRKLRDESWLENVIFQENCWVEIPIQMNSYHLYYRDDITLLQKNVFYMTIAVLLDASLLTVPIILLFVNVLSSIRMQKRMLGLLYLDTATGGRNWTYFQQRSRKILSRIWNSANTYMLISLHMDRYQDYCACYGSKEGEGLLKDINGYLQANMEYGETFARFAKADFGMLMRCDSIEQCTKRMKKLLAELAGVQKGKGLSFCAGLYLIQPEETKKARGAKRRRQMDIDQLYHYAAAARGTVRKKGQYIKVFDQQILDEQLWKHKVEEMMEEALRAREFQVYLQPKYNPVTEKIVGAEALVRWISPADGIIPPDRFIPIFEENGFITKLDDYMISAVAKLKSEWKIQGIKPVPVSVNVSRANFTRTDLARHICSLVDAYGAEHAGIELELTESAFFGDKNILQQILKELKMYGFCISMDDFGAGYSSLNSLKDLPIDVLKLDMDFFRGEDTGKRGEIVVKETIRLARELDMKIVAEGIERKEQVEFLAAQGCDMIQGFYFSKPMPVSEFEKKMRTES